MYSWNWESSEQNENDKRKAKEEDSLKDWKKMIEESSLMPQHNGRGSLSSTSLVNQYRVPISRKTEERIAFFYVCIIYQHVLTNCHSYQHEITNLLTLIPSINFTTQNSEKMAIEIFLLDFLISKEKIFSPEKI